MNIFEEFVKTMEAWPETKFVYVSSSAVTPEFAKACNFAEGQDLPDGQLMGITVKVVPDVIAPNVLTDVSGRPAFGLKKEV